MEWLLSNTEVKQRAWNNTKHRSIHEVLCGKKTLEAIFLEYRRSIKEGMTREVIITKAIEKLRSDGNEGSVKQPQKHKDQNN